MIASYKEMTRAMHSKGNESEKRLQQSVETDAIATLAGGIAHQFNNALVAIVGNIDLLRLDLSGSPEVEKYAKSMRSAVKKMTRLTDQLLAYARRGTYQPMIVSLDQVG